MRSLWLDSAPTNIFQHFMIQISCCKTTNTTPTLHFLVGVKVWMYTDPYNVFDEWLFLHIFTTQYSGKAWEKTVKSSQADRFGRGHPTHSPPHTPASQTASFCENLDPFLSYIKRQNNPKHGNLSRNVHIYLTASGEGVTPSFFPVFLRLP